MTKQAPATGFSASERDYIRRELDMFFSTLPTVAEGFQLKTWRGGPQAGRPKVPPVARSLIDRGLMRLDTSDRLPRLFFTETGLVELRAMMADRRLADPKLSRMSAKSLASTPCRRQTRPRSDEAAVEIPPPGAIRLVSFRPLTQLRWVASLEFWPNWPIYGNCGVSR